MRPRPYAVFSCDLDTVDRHLQGYGFEDLGPCDARMERHPGMTVPLASKRAALRDILATITRERRVLTYRQALEEGLAA
jgi:hypothetical protein